METKNCTLSEKAKVDFLEQADLSPLALAYQDELLLWGYLTPEYKQVIAYENLIKSLDSIEEEILFISIGAGTLVEREEQQCPTYLQNIAQTKKVRSILIDPRFNESQKIKTMEEKFKLEKTNSHTSSYVSREALNLNMEILGCTLLKKEETFRESFKNAIFRVLNKGGRVFIANHTQAWSCVEIPAISDIYNKIKKEHPLAAEGVQLYTQCGSGLVRYYLDKECDNERDGGKEGKFTKADFCLKIKRTLSFKFAID